MGGTPDVTPEMRRQAKMINFGIAYGMSAFGLAQRLRISTRTAKAAIDSVFRALQRRSALHRRGGSKSAGPRVCRDPPWPQAGHPRVRSKNYSIRQLGERLAINTPIQGTAADLIKKAMVDIDAVLGKEKPRGFVCFSRSMTNCSSRCCSDKGADPKTSSVGAMEDVYTLDVPLKVEIGWGANWTQAHA